MIAKVSSSDRSSVIVYFNLGEQESKQVPRRYCAQNTQFINKALLEDDELTVKSMTNLLEATWPEADAY